MGALVEAALAVAKTGLPVFPTTDKRPTWSNKDLGVDKGEGGYKIATTDPERIKELFGHRDALELAIPMGEMSGLICVDIDWYKATEDDALADLEAWCAGWKATITKTLRHRTRSGGEHVFFKHPGDDIRFPATLRKYVDLKAGGNGYVCWPPTEGYKKIGRVSKPKPFPIEMLEEAMKAKGGSGNVKSGSSTFNPETDGEIAQSIFDADELYPALRTLSYRLAGRTYTREEQLEILFGLMDQSVAADSSHPRHDDWEDRRSKIEDLVDSAIEKQGLQLTDKQLDTMAQVGGFTRGDPTETCPIGPQRETSIEDIERGIAKEGSDKSSFEQFSLDDLHNETIEPVEWVVPSFIPKGNTIGLAGASNVGKTRWLAGLVACISTGHTEKLGLPPMTREGGGSVLWVANEERTDDIKRRIKAFARHHGLSGGTIFSVHGKEKGSFALAGLNDIGQTEILEKNLTDLVREIRESRAELVIFDPYVTLNPGGNENGAEGVSILRKAFQIISGMTGAAILFAHHTPKKERSNKADWYRGQDIAFRGSSDIAAQLDCGFTLSPWHPPGGQRKAWEKHHADDHLGRFIQLCPCKIREGEWPKSVMYELVGQEMATGEGMDIGVCRLSNPEEALTAMRHDAADVIRKYEIAKALVAEFGIGETVGLNNIHKRMRGKNDYWPDVGSGKHQGELGRLVDDLVDPVATSCGHVVCFSNAGRKWALEIEEQKDADG